jgi:phosphoenolpyruvate carboxykinase (GTP)
VLRWIIDRFDNKVGAKETPIGFLPKDGDIDVTDLDVSEETMGALLSINIEQWQQEMASIGEYLQEYGDRLPDDLWQEHQKVVDALSAAT